MSDTLTTGLCWALGPSWGCAPTPPFSSSPPGSASPPSLQGQLPSVSPACAPHLQCCAQTQEEGPTAPQSQQQRLPPPLSLPLSCVSSHHTTNQSWGGTALSRAAGRPTGTTAN